MLFIATKNIGKSHPLLDRKLKNSVMYLSIPLVTLFGLKFNLLKKLRVDSFIRENV